MSSKIDFDKSLDAAILASRAAATELLRMFRPSEGKELRTWMKGPGDLVTEADIGADRAIVAALKGAGARGTILSEESETTLPGEGLTWLVDPLCGTVPYSMGMDNWGINVALRSGDRLEVAALSIPSLGEELAGVRGGGVYRNGQPWSVRPPEGDLTDLLICVEKSRGVELARFMAENLRWISQIGHINNFGSCTYGMAQVCLGRTAAGIFPDMGPVHVAAGAMIATELGITVTDGNGSPIAWSSDEDIPVLIVAWPAVHAKLISLINSSD